MRKSHQRHEPRTVRHLPLPPTKRACINGDHIFSVDLGAWYDKSGMWMMKTGCPDCHETITHPVLAKHRRE